MRLINIPNGKTVEKTAALWEALGYNVHFIYDFTHKETAITTHLVEDLMMEYPEKLVIILVE